MALKLRVLSYNIHKGFSANSLNYVLKKLKSSIQEVNADLVLLQEVLGHHEKKDRLVSDWPTAAQFEYLSDQLWPHYAYGKNAVYTEGHHGNAILSRFPILLSHNIDISPNRFERRGMLCAQIQIPSIEKNLQVFCTHLGLFEKDRRWQIERMIEQIKTIDPDQAPFLIGGDFNDWREKSSAPLKSGLQAQEVFLETQNAHARTFPSWYPLLKLDRLYYRNMKLVFSQVLEGKLWSSLSDHLPIVAEFDIQP